MSVFARPARAALLIVVLAAIASGARAATVVMENGEQFAGDIVSMIDGTLLLNNQYAGEIELPWASVVELVSEEPLRLQLPDERLVMSRPGDSQRGMLAVEADASEAPAASSVSRVLALADIAAINRPIEDPYAYDWRGQSNVGLNATTGNSETERFHVDAEGTLENEVNRYIAGVDFNRGSDNGVTSVDNWTAYSSYDRFFDEKLFWNNTLSFKRNTLQELELRTSLGSGLGYQFFAEEDLRLSTTASLSYVSEEFDLQSSEEFMALQLGLDYEHQWFDWLRVFHSTQTLSSFESLDDFVLRTRTGLRYPITNGVMASFQVNVDYDNSPSPGAEKEDVIYAFTLGYRW
jgi:putative salt-induced outer membrane protein YdiY